MSHGAASPPNGRIFFVEVEYRLRTRKSPFTDDIQELAKRHSQAFSPPDDPAARPGHIDACLNLAQRDLVPDWIITYNDPARNKEALDHLLRLHEKRYPRFHEALTKRPRNEQWAYLLARMLYFRYRDIEKITKFDMDKIKALISNTATHIASDAHRSRPLERR